jgi:autotransporter-associated beta strand protein
MVAAARSTLHLVAVWAAISTAEAVTISFVGVEPGTAGSGYATQNWSNPGVSKAYDLSGDVYGTAGYYQIRPISYPPGSTIYSGAAAGNNLGITAGSNPTLYSAPVMLSSITGGAGDYVNFNSYSIFRGPDGSALYTQGGLSVPVNQGPFNTPSGSNSGYFGEAFSFTMGSSMGASFRIGVAVDTVASGTYAPDYVSIYNGGTGSVYSSLLTRDGTPDMAVFDVTAAAGDTFTAALWQLANTQSAAAFGLITFDVSSYNAAVASGAQTNSSVLGGSAAGLLKTGAGTMALTGVSTYQGTTTISNGAVEVGGSGQLASGNYSGAVSLTTNSASLRVNTSANQTLSGAISGNGALAKSANGTLTLSGSNSYSGETTISGGRVITTSSNALGDASAAVTVSGGAYLDVRTNMTRTGSVTFDGGYLATSAGAPASLSKTGGSFVLSNAAEIVAELAGTAGLTSGGTGTSILWRSNSYTGATVVSSGALRLDGSGALSSSTTLQVDSGATFSMTGTFLTSNNVTVAGLAGAGTVTGAAGTLTVNKTSGTDLLTGNIQGGLSLTKSGAGQFSISGSNSYTGATTVNAGVVNLASGNGFGSTDSGTTVANGAVIRIQGTNGGGSGITIGDEALTISGLGVGGSGGALRSASGTNTWQGKVTLAADARIGAAANNLLTLDVASGNAIESANFNLSTEGAGHIRVNDAISLGTGGLTKTGTGSLILTASNSYSGATDIQGGRLSVSGNGRLGSGAITISNASSGSLEFAVSGTNVVANSISGAGALVSSSGETRLTGAVTSTGGLTVSTSTVRIGNGGTTGSYSGSTALSDNAAQLVFDRSDAYTHSGSISGSGGVTKLSAGTTTLTASNSYTGGTLISAGTLELGSGGFIAGGITNNAGLRIGADLTNVVSGSGSLTKATGSTASLWNPNTYTGATVVEAGQLQLDGAGEISSSSTLQVASGATFSATGLFKTSNNLTIAGLSGAGNVYNAAGTLAVNKASGSDTFSGVISGGTAVTKSGAGTWTLSGANSYTGATAVSAGSLVVNGSISSATTVQNGASLGGSGSVASVTVQNGGTIAPGNSPGTLTITNGLTWSGGGNYNWQIFNVSGTAGQTNTWDLINVTGGTWDINGLSTSNKFNINLWSLSGLPDTAGVATGFDASQNYSWKILASVGISGAFNTNLFNINTSANNGTGGFVGASGLFSLAVDANNDLFLTYTGAGAPVPEPGTFASGAVLLLLAAGARWRHSRRKATGEHAPGK